MFDEVSVGVSKVSEMSGSVLKEAANCCNAYNKGNNKAGRRKGKNDMKQTEECLQPGKQERKQRIMK